MKKAASEGENLEALAQRAMTQFFEKEYFAKMSAEMEALGTTQPIVKIGLAYFKKHCAIAQA